MIIDLHIHSKNSDGSLSGKKIFELAKMKNFFMMSITDHDSISFQEKASVLAQKSGINYVSGVELNVTFIDTKYTEQKPIFLDFLGYNFDLDNSQLVTK
ncbi:MAG: PHP domain-containing protein, partial [Candidatus Heimdallarchaeota archaeon]|nr:PHP domain-containing protein [Candidatus Heimdallarchaeota archaeon]